MTRYLFANLLTALKETPFSFQYSNLLDILIVVFLIYGILLLLKRTHSFFMFGGVAVLFIIYIAARFFNLYLTSLIFQTFFAFFIFIFVVIFQREFRNFFEWLSAWGRLSRRAKSTISETVTRQIAQAVKYLADKKIGALIVLLADIPIERLIQGGITLDGRVSTPLLLSIFDPSSPGHDGAVVIEGNRIKKFGAHLPLAEKLKNFEKLGTRHHAALGLAERSDAFIIVVSEERGAVSLAYQGNLGELKDIHELENKIFEFLKERFLHEGKRPWYSFLTNNLKEKILAIFLTSALWMIFAVQFGAVTVTSQFAIPIEFRFLPEEYEIEKLNPKEVSVTLSGKKQNFNLLNKENLRVIIDVNAIREGAQKVKITEDLISYPPALNIIDFSPKKIDFELRKNIKR